MRHYQTMLVYIRAIALMMAGDPGGVSLATATSCLTLDSSSEGRTVSVCLKSSGDEIVSFFSSFILLNLPGTIYKNDT